MSVIPEAVIEVGVVAGLVTLQFKVVVQLVPPAVVIVQDGFAGVRVPDVEPLVSEQDAVEPPFVPTHDQVYAEVPLKLLALLPEVQL